MSTWSEDYDKGIKPPWFFVACARPLLPLCLPPLSPPIDLLCESPFPLLRLVDPPLPFASTLLIILFLLSLHFKFVSSKMVFSFHKSTLVVALTAASFGFFAPSVVSTDATMYFDCCKASSSWPGKAPVYNPVATCYADGKTIVTGPKRDDPNSSGCGGGYEYQCSCQQPWTDDVNPTVGYAFAAMTSTTESENACACYVVNFSGAQSGKVSTLFYQVINDGGDVTSDGLDILVPGMGVGAMTTGCSSQWKDYDTSKWGQQYGGLDRDRAGCFNLPPDLQHGCLWRMDDWGNSVTMQGRPQRVRCSKAHIDRTGCQRKDEPATTFQGHYDTAHNGPAPDGYTPNPSVCGIGSSQRRSASLLFKAKHQSAKRHHAPKPGAADVPLADSLPAAQPASNPSVCKT